VKLVIQRTEMRARFVVDDQWGLSNPVHPEGQNPAADSLALCCCGSLREVVVAVAGESEAGGGDFASGVFAEGGNDGIRCRTAVGDNQKFDFVVWRRDGRAVRVQVKGTGRLHRRGYEVQPVHTTRRGGKKRYTKKDIDVIAAHVQPVDAWYLIPIEKVGRAKSLRMYPGIEVKTPRIAVVLKARSGKNPQPSQQVARWERWRDAWDVIAKW